MAIPGDTGDEHFAVTLIRDAHAAMSGLDVLLASQESSFVTAEIYGVTGGNHLP